MRKFVKTSYNTKTKFTCYVWMLATSTVHSTILYNKWINWANDFEDMTKVEELRMWKI